MGLDSTVRLELMSADPQGAIDSLLQRGLSLYSVHRIDDLMTVFTVKRSEMPMIQSILGSRGDTLRPIGEKGPKVFLKHVIRRPVLLIGLMIHIFLTLFIPTRLILFRVEGNKELSASFILEEAQDRGLSFWSKRKEVRSEEIKNELIARIPQITWVGINTNGCVATISVREREPGSPIRNAVPGSVYATRDGIISSITASKGTAVCSPGDAVIKGQLLISGFTDCGDLLLLEAAEGEVYAYTSRSVRAVFPTNRYAERPSGSVQRRYSMVIGKKRINFWKGSGISPAGCDRMYQEYWLKLPGGGMLPVCIIRETIIRHDTVPFTAAYGEESTSEVLDLYIRQQMPGGKILHREVRFTEADGLYILDGRFGCLEMIGKKIVEQIGENVWQER